METIIVARGAGKTTMLLKMAIENQLCLVCESREEVFTLMQRLGLDRQPVKLVTFDEFLNGQYDPIDINGFVIDDVDLLLCRFTQSAGIFAVSMTAARQTVPSDKAIEIKIAIQISVADKELQKLLESESNKGNDDHPTSLDDPEGWDVYDDDMGAE